MRAFDLKLALEGHKLITRDKKHKNLVVRSVNPGSLCPLKLVNAGEPFGSRYLDGTECSGFKALDLFIQEESDLVETNTNYSEIQIKEFHRDKVIETYVHKIHEDDNFLIYKKVK